jgi:hypothetical protein
MEFLDVNLKEDSSLLLHCNSQSLLLADFKENHTLLWFLKSFKKSAKQENSTLFMNSIICIEWKNVGRKPDKNSSLRRLEFRHRNIDKKCRSRIPSLDTNRYRTKYRSKQNILCYQFYMHGGLIKERKNY